MSGSELDIVSAEEIGSPVLRALGAFWNLKRGAEALLARSQFLPEEWGRWWSCMMLYRVERDANEIVFRMAYQGDDLARTDGGGKIGKRLEEIVPESISERTLRAYTACATRGLPHFTARAAPLGGRMVTFQRLLLPLGAACAVDHVLGAVVDEGIRGVLARDDLFQRSSASEPPFFAQAFVEPTSFAAIDPDRLGRALGAPGAN
ncbi:MAG: PAS domain-containing protein [Tagaea sp.]|nr:PAS domain-containing protein [Tagaea sp.]